MNVVKPCTMCDADKNKPCSCKEALTSFFKLLEKAHQRVLTTKATSSHPPLPLAGAGLDKLNGAFQCLPLRVDVVAAAKALNLDAKLMRLDNKPCLRIGDHSLFVHFLLDPSQKFLTGLNSNPNRFDCWGAYVGFLADLLPKSSIQSLNLTRIDLNLDFNLSFFDLIQKIDFKAKSTSIQYEEKSGERTGLYIGKGSEQLVIYDKAKKDQLPNPHSRIELRLKGDKLPTKSFYEIPLKLTQCNFFSNVEGKECRTKELPISEFQVQKLNEFRSIQKRDGLFSARKAMNRNRNFERDFSQILEFTKWQEQPSQLFKRLIQGFFDPNRGASKMMH